MIMGPRKRTVEELERLLRLAEEKIAQLETERAARPRMEPFRIESTPPTDNTLWRAWQAFGVEPQRYASHVQQSLGTDPLDDLMRQMEGLYGNGWPAMCPCPSCKARRAATRPGLRLVTIDHDTDDDAN